VYQWLTWKDQVLVSLVRALWVIWQSGSVDTLLSGRKAEDEHDQQIKAGFCGRWCVWDTSYLGGGGW
jgi:hypothetical protein